MSWVPEILGDVCSLITDGKHGNCKNETGSGYYFISCKDVKNGLINYEEARQIVHKDFAETHRRTDLKPGDILLTNSGTIGRLAIAPEGGKTTRTTLQKSVAILKPIQDKITSHFLYYSLAANKNRLINSAGGAAQKNLLLGELKRFPIDVPSLVTQNKIASILSAYDNLIENNRRRIQLLEESVRLLYKEWFVHLRFPGHEHTKIIDGVPEGWERKTLGEYAVLNYGKALKKDNRVEGKYPVYGSSGIVGSHNKAIVKSPAIIIGRKGNVGSIFWSLCDCWPIDTVYFIQSEKSDLYLYYVLKNMTFISTDVAVPGLNRNFAYSRQIIIPEEKMKEEFKKEATLIHAQIEKLEHYNQKLTQARDLLLPRLMNGEIEV